MVAFTPKGGCPLKRERVCSDAPFVDHVAFTPKGGCPLKRVHQMHALAAGIVP